MIINSDSSTSVPGTRFDNTVVSAISSDTEFAENTIEQNNIKISLVPSKRKKVKKVNVIVEGEFNINTAGIVKENCSKLLKHFEFVRITLKNIVDIDLAAIQLLHLLSTSSDFPQRTITIDSELSKEDRSLVSSSGLTDVLSKQKNND
jgi:hypothetical protein